MLIIPQAPGKLGLPITNFWNGIPCKDVSKHGLVCVSRVNNGLQISAELAMQKNPNVPQEPFGAYVPNLWEYDVVECFLVGERVYLEVEFGAAGHILVLDFSEPRKRLNAYPEFCSQVQFKAGSSNATGAPDRAMRWHSSINIPWSIVPEKIKAINAFVIVRDNFLAYSPLPGNEPDFHQPVYFPVAGF